MLQPILKLCLAAIVWIGPAHAEMSPTKIRELLMQGEFDALQERFEAEYAQALQDKDFGALRHVNDVIFNTTHPDHQQQAVAWLEASPNSAYAATALAWGYIDRAFHYRGAAYVNATSRESLSEFSAGISKARAMTDLALQLAPDYIPAVDALILLEQIKSGDFQAFRRLKRALEIAPDRHTAVLALNALQTRWGGGTLENMRVCNLLVEHIPRYDAELCFIELVFRNDVDGMMRNRALAALEERKEPFLDYARLDAYLLEWRNRPEALSEAKRIHRDMLESGENAVAYMSRLKEIDSTFQTPFYKLEAKDALIAKLEAALPNDPHDLDILITLTNEIFERIHQGDPAADNGKAREYWLAMLPYGHYREEVWYIGVRVRKDATSLKDPDRLQQLYGNAVYYGNYNPGILRSYRNYVFERYLWLTGGYGHDASELPANKEALAERFPCPLLRVQRLYDLACDADRNNPACHVNGYTSDYSNRVYRLAESNKKCAAFLHADFDSLSYSPTSHFVFLDNS